MAPDAALAARASTFDAVWLRARRWFRGKSRQLSGVSLHDAAPLDGERGWLLVLAAAYLDGGEERYLVPAVVDGEDLREPADGEGVWRMLVSHLAGGTRVLAGGGGTFAFDPTDALHRLLDAASGELEERRLSVEQSNTSVRLGDRLMLKIYRLLEPGINPEVEVSAFLTAAGFPHAPALGGTVTYRPETGEPAAAAMVQQLVAARGDGWEWALRCLGSPPDGPLEALAGAAQIGGITAELHAALASRPQDVDFPARAATRDELEEWRAGAERALDGARASVSGDQAVVLERLAPRVRERLAEIPRARGARLSRIHGDYHLGQLLRTESGFAVVDFEGEPARPLTERRRPGSPLRDVAGMLRSFDYAARISERAGPDGFAADTWLGDARAALLNAYGATGPHDSALLAAFELEKACYEVRYEAGNRPDWTWLPLAALERLAS